MIEISPASLENALEKKCKNLLWLAWILFLTASPVIFNATHLASFAFLGGDPSFFCDVPELVEANWTKEQIREISSPGLKKQSCVQFAWNYTLLKDLSFDEALSYFNQEQKPDVIKCKDYIYVEEVTHQTVTTEWNLVCDDSAVGTTLQSSVAIGKLCGAVAFGLIGDRFGRKKIFVLSCLLYAVSSTAAAFANSSSMFIILRLLTGLAGGGVYDSCFTLLLELTVKQYRACLGNLFNLSYSFGMIYISLAAYLTKNWRQLQLAISLPTFFLIFHCWFYPESPRWLITTGDFDKAAKIIGKEHNLSYKETSHSLAEHPRSLLHKVVIFWKNSIALFSKLELVKRLFICSFLWFIGNLYYFLIALNGTNIDVNVYLYVILNALIEMPGNLPPIFLLKYFGRKPIGVSMWSVAGVVLLIIIVIPKGWPVMAISLFGRVAAIGAFGAVLLFTSELFPTEHRNFAIGICTTVAQFGPLLTPYIVDTLGKKAWWMPTTVCGLLSVLGALLLLLLPETRNTPMPDRVEEMNLG